MKVSPYFLYPTSITYPHPTHLPFQYFLFYYFVFISETKNYIFMVYVRMYTCMYLFKFNSTSEITLYQLIEILLILCTVNNEMYQSSFNHFFTNGNFFCFCF